jgi:filamentous hemagglutinin family protein
VKRVSSKFAILKLTHFPNRSTCPEREVIDLPGKDRHALRYQYPFNSIVYRVAALALALLVLGCDTPSRAQSVLPHSGSIAAGSATIGTPANNGQTITETAPNAVINWNSFSVGQPNSVTFVQPGSSSAILNRVTGGTPSTIAGQLNANDQVYLVNPNGIAITKSGTVSVRGGFVTTPNRQAELCRQWPLGRGSPMPVASLLAKAALPACSVAQPRRAPAGSMCRSARWASVVRCQAGTCDAFRNPPNS